MQQHQCSSADQIMYSMAHNMQQMQQLARQRSAANICITLALLNTLCFGPNLAMLRPSCLVGMQAQLSAQHAPRRIGFVCDP
eukprot:1468093-Amphidinium_carterae.1